MGATEFDKPLDNDFATINTNLGSPTSASGVTGADAFTKINTLNSKLIDYQSGGWTPSFGRDTASNMYASWIAIGNILFITAQWSNTHGSGASYIEVSSLPSIQGKRLNYGLHGTWRSSTTDVAGEIGQYTESSSIRFSKGGVGVELPSEPISFNAIAFLVNT